MDRGGNPVTTDLDPTSYAEIVAIRGACRLASARCDSNVRTRRELRALSDVLRPRYIGEVEFTLDDAMIRRAWWRLHGLLRARRQRVAVKGALARLARSPNPRGAIIVRAVEAVWRKQLEPSERNWVEQIEAYRSSLLNQRDRMIAFHDFGAGLPGDNLSAAQMEQGRTVTRSVADVVAHGSLGYEWRLLLFHLIRGLRPAMCVEMGTALGMSAAFQAAALALNGRGRLVTAEGAPTFADAARQHLDALGLSAVRIVVGRFQDTLDGILREHRPVDYAFVDGHHDGDATVAYFKQFLPHLSDGALLVFDDILYYPSMQRGELGG